MCDMVLSMLSSQTFGHFYLLTKGTHWEKKKKDREKVHPVSSDVVKSYFCDIERNITFIID